MQSILLRRSGMTRSTALITLILGLVGCDPYWYVAVRASVVRPVSSSCLDSTFRKLIPSTLYTGFPVGHLFPLSQRVEKNGSAVLETSVHRFGHAFSKIERDSIGHDLGALLVAVRDSCGGTPVQGQAPFFITRGPLP